MFTVEIVSNAMSHCTLCGVPYEIIILLGIYLRLPSVLALWPFLRQQKLTGV